MPEGNESNQPTPIPGDDATAAGAGSTADVGLNDGLLRKLRIRIPGYELLDVIGRGGQATVYKAIELTDSKMPVAIKILHSGPLADPTARERLRREARAMRALIGSPNIVSAFADGQTEEGHDYLIMNFIDGKPLDEFWKHRRPGTDDTESSAAQLSLFKKICDAVALAHRRGITHRDLSPSNILVDERGEPHILDFGLARTAFDQFNSPEMKSVSVTGQFIGKLSYASPEQAGGVSAAIDVRTDVYALGIILYQILTGGRFPYQVVGTLLEVLNNIIHVTPVRPSEAVEAGLAQEIQSRRTLRPGRSSRINRTVEEIVLKALEKKPEDRYQTAGELGTEIGRYLAGQPTLASLSGTPPTGSSPTVVPSTARLSRFVPAAVVTGAVAVAALLSWSYEQGRRGTAAVPRPAAATARAAPPSTKPVLPTALEPPLTDDLQRRMALMPPVSVKGNWRVEASSLIRDEEPDHIEQSVEFGDPDWTDYDFKSIVSWKVPDTEVSLSAHVLDIRNYWEISVAPWGADNLDLHGLSTVEDGWQSPSRRWMPDRFKAEAGRPYLMELRVRGAKVTVLMDGRTICDSEDENLKSGRVRLTAFRGARFDDITVTTPDGTLLWKGPPALPMTMADAGYAQSLGTGTVNTITNTLGMKLVELPLGSFTMGSPTNEDSRQDDETQHSVRLTRRIMMSVDPVTRGEFTRFVGDTHYVTDAERKRFGDDLAANQDGPARWNNPGFLQRIDEPVVAISWHDAIAFCDWLSSKDGNHYRLPTEAEAEYACRAGTTTPYGIDDPTQFRRYAWYDVNSRSMTHPVGHKSANTWGLHDMLGDAAYWCQDWYGTYPAGDAVDPVGPPFGRQKVTRGGNFGSNQTQCRCAARGKANAHAASNLLGMRVVMDLR